MKTQAFLVVLLICSLNVNLQIGVIAGRWNISAEEDLELEKTLKMLNKPARKTILTDDGDIYDCVDFYKQPAFDHPLLKDYKVDFSVKVSPRSQQAINRNGNEHIELGLKDGGCPFGTVPIRRITKEDLIRQKIAAKTRSLVDDNIPGAHYAVFRTRQDSTKYTGAACAGSVWQPEVTSQQYSAGRMRISNGAESLEVGWRVDPTLFGDTKSHFYIRTDAGQTHCFNALCPGFIVVDTSVPLGIPIQPSQRGGGIKQVPFFLSQDTANGNWNLQILDEQKVVGFWPKQIFTSLGNSATSAEWGGEVFSPPGTPTPAMGSGSLIEGKKNSTTFDAYFGRLSLTVGTTIGDADFLEPFTDNKRNYNVDFAHTDTTEFKNLMFYGGAGAP